MKCIKLTLSVIILSIISIQANGQTNIQDKMIKQISSFDHYNMKVIEVEPTAVDDSFTKFTSLSVFLKMNNINYEPAPYKEKGTIVKGSGDKIRLYAEYDNSGELVTSRLIKENTPLPGSIYRYLVENHPEWTMSSNKTKIEDFSTANTTYKVTIKKDGRKKALTFDSNGKIMK